MQTVYFFPYLFKPNESNIIYEGYVMFDYIKKKIEYN